MKRVVALIVVLTFAALAVLGWRDGWAALWATPDQRGAWLLAHDEAGRAADAFADPVWRGVALMDAGRFAEAAQSFAAADTPEAAYDGGNAMIMLGKYEEAVALYDHALAGRPGWADAAANRTLAELRAARIAHRPGQEADPEEKGMDEVYRKDRDRSGHAEGADQAVDAMGDEAIRALWLRRVQTKPADFLRSRFAYQLQDQRP
ncbi:MAG: hypothetical protein JOZ42_06140 [Acetobacteraceae bacterium]|nr:hypothetical protein [Acetobacteraceae bacterium]